MVIKKKKRRKSLRCRVIQKFRHTERDTVPGTAHSVITLALFYGTRVNTMEEEVSPQSLHLRHLPIIPSLGPPCPSTPIQLPCLLTLSPASLLPSITSCLCFRSRRARSQGCPSREQCCYETKVGEREREKEIGAVSGDDQTRAPLCCSCTDGGRKQKNRKRGVQVDEHVLYSQLGARLVPATAFVYIGNLAFYSSPLSPTQ